MGTPFLSPSLLSALPAEKLGHCSPYSGVSGSCSGSWKVWLSGGTFQGQPQLEGLQTQPHLRSSHPGSPQGRACEKLASWTR